jgi:hypothetical protein
MRRNKPAFSQQGMALPIVLILMVCITFVALGFAALYTARARLNTAYVHTYNAQYGDETGLNRYLWVLNNDPYDVSNFLTQNNNTYSGYSQEGNYYYNITAQTQSTSLTPSLINLKLTGWYANDPNHPFSFTAQVKARQFCQYLYFTQQETTDTQNGPTVYWGPGDVLHGGLFTNGNIHTKDNDDVPGTYYTPVFEDVVNYAGNQANDIADSSIPAAMQKAFPAMAPTYLPQQQSKPLIPPPNNSELKAFAQGPQGYYFQGRTSIWLDGNQFYYDCKGPTAMQGTKSLPVGTRQGPYPLPENGVIYVDNNGETDTANYPITNSNGQNSYYQTEDGRKFDANLGNVFVSGTLQGQLTIGAANNIYLTAGDPTMPSGTPSQNFVTYQNTSFTPNGSDTEYTGANGTDMLGLIANNYVMILRWGWPTDSSDDNSFASSSYPATNDYTTADYYLNSPQSNTPEHEIDAAIMAIHYTFCYEDVNWEYNPYPAGASTATLKIVGAVMQNYRGTISAIDLPAYAGGTSLGNGYLKDYWFDPRMTYEAPPHYVQPTGDGWGIWSWTSSPGSPMTFPPATSITGVSMTVPNASPASGTSEQLNAAVNPSSVNPPQTVNWSLSDPSNTGTTIDPSGYLTAGTANINPSTGTTVTVTATSNVYPSFSHSATITIY